MSNDLTPPGPPQPDQPVAPTYPSYYPAPPAPPGPSGYARFVHVDGLRSQGTDRTMASWALGLAVVGACWVAWLVGLVLAIVVLARGNDGVDRGRKRAVWALVVCGIWAVVLVVYCVHYVLGELDERDDRTPRGDAQASTAPGEVLTTDLSVGDCLRNPPDTGTTTALDVVGCRVAHHGEVYALFDLPGDDYPGHDRVVQLAERGCISRVASNGFTRKQLRGLSMYYYTPLRTNFETNPGVICVFESDEARLSAVR